MNVEEISEVLLSGKLSFKYFAEKIVKEMDGFKLEIPKFQEEWVEHAMRYQNVVISASRGHGKTMVLGVLFPLYLATYNSNLSFLIISPTEDRAAEILAKIRYVIESNELLKSLKPATASGTWTKTKLDTTNRCQFYCRCLTKHLRGYQVDYLLVEEAGQIEDIDLFFSVALPTIYSKNGKCVAIGTPESNYDLLARLRRTRHFKYFEYPAIVNGKPLWPERFSITKLKTIKRTIGPARFRREYLLDYTYSPRKVFPPNLVLSCLDDNASLLDSGSADRNYFIGVDLAASPRGDYTVFAIVEEDIDRSYRLAYLERMRGVPPSIQERKLIDLCGKFPPRKIVVDRSLFGQTMVNDLRAAGLPVEGFDFTIGKRGMLFNTLQRFMADKKLKFPYNEHAKNVIQTLIKELDGIEFDSNGRYVSKTSHDDTVIALALAMYAASQYKSCLVYGKANVGTSNLNIYPNRYNYEYKSYKRLLKERLLIHPKYREAYF